MIVIVPFRCHQHAKLTKGQLIGFFPRVQLAWWWNLQIAPWYLTHHSWPSNNPPCFLKSGWDRAYFILNCSFLFFFSALFFFMSRLHSLVHPFALFTTVLSASSLPPHLFLYSLVLIPYFYLYLSVLLLTHSCSFFLPPFLPSPVVDYSLLYYSLFPIFINFLILFPHPIHLLSHCTSFHCFLHFHVSFCLFLFLQPFDFPLLFCWASFCIILLPNHLLLLLLQTNHVFSPDSSQTPHPVPLSGLWRVKVEMWYPTLCRLQISIKRAQLSITA